MSWASSNLSSHDFLQYSWLYAPSSVTPDLRVNPSYGSSYSPLQLLLSSRLPSPLLPLRGPLLYLSRLRSLGLLLSSSLPLLVLSSFGLASFFCYIHERPECMTTLRLVVVGLFSLHRSRVPGRSQYLLSFLTFPPSGRNASTGISNESRIPDERLPVKAGILVAHRMRCRRGVRLDIREAWMSVRPRGANR